MAETQDGLGLVCIAVRARAEMRFEDIALRALAVQLDPASERLGMSGGEIDTRVDRAFVIGWRFGGDEPRREIKKR